MIFAHTIFHHNGTLLVIYMVLLVVTALWFVLPEFSRNRRVPKYCILWLGLLTFFMAILPIQSGDFAYYGIAFRNGSYNFHLEDFYKWLWDAVDRNYLTWRAIVWGASTILLLLSIKSLKINTYFAAFIFIITQWYFFGNLRNMLGFMAMFYGVIVMLRRGNALRKTHELIIGTAFIFASIFLHRSMFAYVTFMVLALIPFGKRTMAIGLGVFPILYASVYTLSKYVLLYIGADEEAITHANGYLRSEIVNTTMQNFNNIVIFSSYAYLLWLIVRNRSNDGLRVEMPAIYKFLTRYAYIMMYAGALFFMQSEGGWMFIRLSKCGYTSLMFVIMYYFYHYPRTRGVKIAFAAQIYIIVYFVLYILFRDYNSFVKRIVLFDL